MIPTTGVWVYKEAGTDELKYSIRSAVQNLGLTKVILIGDKPNWYKESELAVHIPLRFRRPYTWTNAYVPWTYLKELLKANLLTGDFLYFNDDFFVLKKLTAWTDYERDPLDYDLYVRQHNRMYHQREVRSLKLLGLDEYGKHYNLHIPIKLNTNFLAEDIKFWHSSPIKDIGFRTFYGNKHLGDCPKIRDVKYRPSESFLSTGEVWWRANGGPYKELFKTKTFAEI